MMNEFLGHLPTLGRFECSVRRPFLELIPPCFLCFINPGFLLCVVCHMLRGEGGGVRYYPFCELVILLVNILSKVFEFIFFIHFLKSPRIQIPFLIILLAPQANGKLTRSTLSISWFCSKRI